jgi:hypothetical protein
MNGVYQRKNGSWCARIASEGSWRHLGTFPTEEEAKAAREQAEAQKPPREKKVTYRAILKNWRDHSVYLGTFDTPEEAEAAKQAFRDNWDRQQVKYLLIYPLWRAKCLDNWYANQILDLLVAAGYIEDEDRLEAKIYLAACNRNHGKGQKDPLRKLEKLLTSA